MESITDGNGITVVVESLIGGRSENQDDYGMETSAIGLLALVCDGMGGGPAGKTASSMAREAILDYVVTADAGSNPGLVLRQAVLAANAKLLEAQENSPALRGMGSTCVGVLINGNKGYIVHVGDSRCYQIRNGRKQFRTNDHSYVAELVRRGTISEEEARTSNYSNVITQAIGIKPEITPEIDVVSVEPGDRFALMSDGVWGTMPEDLLVSRLWLNPDIQATVSDITKQVDVLGHDNGGGHDNLTLSIVAIPVGTPSGNTVRGKKQIDVKTEMKTPDSADAKVAESKSRGIGKAEPKTEPVENVSKDTAEEHSERKAAKPKEPEVSKRNNAGLIATLVVLLVVSCCVCAYLLAGREEAASTSATVTEAVEKVRQVERVKPVDESKRSKSEKKEDVALQAEACLDQAKEILTSLRDEKLLAKDGKPERKEVAARFVSEWKKVLGLMEECLETDPGNPNAEKLRELLKRMTADKFAGNMIYISTKEKFGELNEDGKGVAQRYLDEITRLERR